MESTERDDRREFLKKSSAAMVLSSSAGTFAKTAMATDLVAAIPLTLNDQDSLYHGDQWETLNPGYWQIKRGALRRRLSNYGDRARRTGFPFHYETHRRNNGVMDVNYDPSLPQGIIYRRDWRLKGNYAISATFTFRGRKVNKRKDDSDDWKMYQLGYGQMGLAIGAKSLFESYGKNRNATIASWTDDGSFQVEPKKGKEQTEGGTFFKVHRSPRWRSD